MGKVHTIISNKLVEGRRQTTIDIQGTEYIAHWYDWYIFDAINLVEKWSDKMPEKATYDFIVNLRYWIRENYQHTHNLPYIRIRTYKGLVNFINGVVKAEYEHYEGDDKDAIIESLLIKE